MKKLQRYLDRKNQWNAIFGGKPLVIGQDNQRIADMIDGDLSPENLTCDGELPRSQELRRLDPTVKFYEFS